MKNNSNKRVLVTGGAGFIGSHLCEKLLNNGNEVICADNIFTGSKANIELLMKNPMFEFIRYDICFSLILYSFITLIKLQVFIFYGKTSWRLYYFKSRRPKRL